MIPIGRAQPERAASYLLIGLALAAIMHQWLLDGGVPLTVRAENVPEINYIWQIRGLIETGHAFTPWNPRFLAGEAVATHIQYPIYWSIALLSWLTQISVESWSIGITYLLLLLSSIVTREWVWQLTGESLGSLGAGLVMALLPARFNAIEGFYLQLSWLGALCVFWLYERGFAHRQQPSRRSAIGLGLAAGSMAWASIQIPLMMALVLPPYLLLRELTGCRRGSWCRRRGSRWLLTAAVALGIAASYYLPTLLELPHLGFSRFSQDSSGVTIDLGFLATMLWFRWSPEMAPTRWHHVTWYLGGLTLLLALWGSWRGRRRGVPLFCTLLALTSLLLMAGESLGGLPNLPYRAVEALPLLQGVLRRSFRWVLPLTLALALLAGWGLAASVHSLRRAGRLPSPALPAAMLLLTALWVIDYWPHTASFRTKPAYLSPEQMAAAAWLSQQPVQSRYLMPFDPGLDEAGYLRGYEASFLPHLVPMAGIWQDDYIGHFAPARSSALLAAASPSHPLWSTQWTPAMASALNLGSVRYLLLHLDVAPQAELYASAHAAGLETRFSQGSVRILENPHAQTEYQFYTKIARESAVDAGEHLARWLPDADPIGIYDYPQNEIGYAQSDLEARLSVELGPDGGQMRTPEAATLPPPAAQTTIRVTQATAAQQTLAVSTSAPGMLVLNQAWYPGWQVSVNQQPQPLLRAHRAFLGVLLPAGQHLVTFYFQPRPYVYLGWAISGLTLAACAWLLRRPRARRPAPERKPP